MSLLTICRDELLLVKKSHTFMLEYMYLCNVVLKYIMILSLTIRKDSYA